eukprot:JP443712.1.p2 GENE.JP443712.1~~JP443712.1.p2  ORF type:complete len:64 (-),score=11.19 JP443712.1:60-251(-)
MFDVIINIKTQLLARPYDLNPSSSFKFWMDKFGAGQSGNNSCQGQKHWDKQIFSSDSTCGGSD